MKQLAPAPSPGTILPSLLDITLDDIAAGLDHGRFTVVDLVRAYIKRIGEVDDHFRSIIEINPDAEAIAQSLDAEIKTTGRRGPLHGVPIILKDNIVTLDKMEATAGSFILLGAKPANESTVAANLRRAGCVLLGKAALSEWANYRWTNAPSGWNARRGQCTGAFYPNMKASGSSTGSAVATSLGLCFAAIGTETDGSVCHPAGKASLIGLKSSPGLISRDGTIPGSDRVDAIGVFARNVKDSATILSFAAGKSGRDPLTNDIPFDKIPDYTVACAGTDLHGIKIGVPTTAIGPVEPEEAESFWVALSELKELGAEIVHDVGFLAEEDWKALTPRQRRMITQGDLSSSIEAYLKTLATNPLGLQTLQDITELTKKDPREDFPNHDVESFEFSLFIDRESQEFKELEALRDFINREAGMKGAMDRHQLDVLVTPTCSAVPVTFASLERSPILSFPLGFYPPDKAIQKDPKGDLITVGPGIPYPICFYARRFAEDTLLKVAYAFEKAHNKGSFQLYMLPDTDLEQVVRDRVSRLGERGSKV
ncbi:putative amidase [Chaetomium sp. MPI-SDFR-AT-0129]|nr:putative amidase [Chaetomium sp. MPI-SDFR-AT-0129]